MPPPPLRAPAACLYLATGHPELPWKPRTPLSRRRSMFRLSLKLPSTLWPTASSTSPRKPRTMWKEIDQAGGRRRGRRRHERCRRVSKEWTSWVLSSTVVVDIYFIFLVAFCFLPRHCGPFHSFIFRLSPSSRQWCLMSEALIFRNTISHHHLCHYNVARA